MMGRSDRAKVMARLRWTESEKQHLEAALQGRQHETALVGLAPDVAGMALDVAAVLTHALHATGVRPGDPTADIIFAFAFARFHRKLVKRLRKNSLLLAILLQGGRLDASADQFEEIHMEPPANMDGFFMPVSSDTAAEWVAAEHGFQ